MGSPCLPFLLALLALAPCAGGAESAPRSADGVQIAGRIYVRAGDWAKANGLQIRWIKRERIFQLTSASTKITLVVDSSEAQVNGVGVWLCFPAVLHQGEPFLARLDAKATLLPLLSPPRDSSGSAVKSICLDPGHGGKDPGNHVRTYQEKKYTLLLAQEVARQLTKAGFRVMLTRWTDTTVELPERAALANRRKADLFVSLHFNSADSSRTVVRGAEVYCLTPVGASSTNARGEGANAGASPGNRNNDKNMFLAYQVQKALTRSLTVNDRGVRRARFEVLREATMPAVLIEAGFMSHPEEGNRIFDAGYRRQIAQAIVDGIKAYKEDL